MYIYIYILTVLLFYIYIYIILYMFTNYNNIIITRTSRAHRHDITTAFMRIWRNQLISTIQLSSIAPLFVAPGLHEFCICDAPPVCDAMVQVTPNNKYCCNK